MDVEKEMLDIKAMLQEMIDIVNTKYNEDGTPFTMGPSVEVRAPSYTPGVWTGTTFPSFINIMKDSTSIVNRGHHGKTLDELLTSMHKKTKEELEMFREGRVWGIKGTNAQ